MVTLSSTTVHNSTMPFGTKVKVRLTSVNNVISLYGPAEETVVPSTHGFMRLETKPKYVLGVVNAYNHATETDITRYITTVTDHIIYFDSNYVENGQLIELELYTNWEGIRDDYSSATGTLSKASTELSEQLYRFVSNLDRIDFGNYSPPFDPVFDIVSSSHDSSKYTYHPRLFFACNGYYATDTIAGSSASSGGVITQTPRTIINYSPGSVKTVGGFIGDSAFASVRGGNENYTVIPSPMYLTELVFFCKLKNNSYSHSIAEAIRLNMSVDGQSRAFGTAPDYSITTGRYPFKGGGFGSGNDLILSFSGASDYSGLPPVYRYAKQLDDGTGTSTDTDYFIFRIPLGIIRINSGITVNASILSGEQGEVKVEDYVFTIGGIIPVSWEAP